MDCGERTKTSVRESGWEMTDEGTLCFVGTREGRAKERREKRDCTKLAGGILGRRRGTTVQGRGQGALVSPRVPPSAFVPECPMVHPPIPEGGTQLPQMVDLGDFGFSSARFDAALGQLREAIPVRETARQRMIGWQSPATHGIGWSAPAVQVRQRSTAGGGARTWNNQRQGVVQIILTLATWATGSPVRVHINGGRPICYSDALADAHGASSYLRRVICWHVAGTSYLCPFPSTPPQFTAPSLLCFLHNWLLCSRDRCDRCTALFPLRTDARMALHSCCWEMTFLWADGGFHGNMEGQ